MKRDIFWATFGILILGLTGLVLSVFELNLGRPAAAAFVAVGIFIAWAAFIIIRVRRSPKGSLNGLSPWVRGMIVVVPLVIVLTVLQPISPRKLDAARTDSTLNQIRQLGMVLNDFKTACGTYPTSAQGLITLLKMPEDLRKDFKCITEEPFLSSNKFVDDAWGKHIEYTSDGKTFVLRASHDLSLGSAELHGP